MRPDAIICTGRSDYPNQVNNVLCFPFIFRGALDVGATAINEEMKLAAVRAIAELAHAEQSEVVASAYGDQDLSFGPEYIIPKPFDPRLIVKIAPAVAKAAMESGVATRPIADFDVYIDKLTEFVYKTNLFMKPIFSQARKAPKRVVLPGGELSRIALAIQVITARKMETPALIFDEVDVGISGPTAAVVGKLLRQLGESTQVMCVTHLPQVAGYGHQHYFVSKETDGAMTETHMQSLDKKARLQELARLLGGSEVTRNTLANAKELLAA